MGMDGRKRLVPYDFPIWATFYVTRLFESRSHAEWHPNTNKDYSPAGCGEGSTRSRVAEIVVLTTDAVHAPPGDVEVSGTVLVVITWLALLGTAAHCRLIAGIINIALHLKIDFLAQMTLITLSFLCPKVWFWIKVTIFSNAVPTSQAFIVTRVIWASDKIIEKFHEKRTA